MYPRRPHLALTWLNRPSAIAVRAVQIASVLTHLTYIYFFYDPWPTLVGFVFATAGLVAMGMLAAPAFRAMARDVYRQAVRKPRYGEAPA